MLRVSDPLNIRLQQVMKNKKVACISAHEADEDLSLVLRDSDWEIEHLDVSEPLDRIPALRDCPIGIIILATKEPEWLSRLQSAVAHFQRLVWVAVVDRALITDEHVRQFIAVNCIDYQTMPLDRDRVLFALGHAAGMATLARQVRSHSRIDDPILTILGGSRVTHDLRGELNLKAARDQAERIAILAALQQSGGSAAKSAPMVGVSRATFYRLLEKHGFTSFANGDLQGRLVSE